MGEIPLQALEFSSSTCPDGQNAGTTHGMLHVTAAQVAPAPEVGAWRPLLEAAVPRRKQLHSLSMQSCRFSVFGAPSVMLGAPQCAQLRELQLLDCLAQPSTHSMDDIVRGLLPSLPDLSCFKLSSPADPKAGHRLREFPAAIFSHPALTRAEVLTVRKEDWDELAMPLLLDPRECAWTRCGATELAGCCQSWSLRLPLVADCCGDAEGLVCRRRRCTPPLAISSGQQ